MENQENQTEQEFIDNLSGKKSGDITVFDEGTAQQTGQQKKYKKYPHKKFNHIAVSPETFAMFRKQKNTKSDDAFVIELIRAYDYMLSQQT